MTISSLSFVRIVNNRLCFILFSFSFLFYFSFIFYFGVQDQVSVMLQALLLSSYHYLVQLVLIGNSSVLSSFYTSSKYNMKLNQFSKMSTVEITKFFLKPGEQSVVATTYHKGQMISLTSKPQRSMMQEFTRELDKESLLNQCPIYTNVSWSVLPLSKPVLQSMCQDC